jgi:NAD(P)-dependent dehydrogenase (short-subunit alcohol dehydrogenase family)
MERGKEGATGAVRTDEEGRPASASWFETRAGLTGAVAVVVGGAGGLGSAIVTDLVANGVRVAVLDSDEAAVRDMQVLLSGEDGAIVTAGDARDPDVLAQLFGAVDDAWGRLDVLVNVVGGTFQAPFVDTTPGGWDALLRLNLKPVLHACALAIPLMRAGGRGGSIVNLSTIEAHRAAPGFAVYSAAKAAVEQFARTLAVELAPDGIRVNNVAPDYVPTPHMTRQFGGGSAAHDEQVLRAAIPLARAGALTDVSGCVVFLASQLSGYVTGSTLHPDGGTFASSGWFNWPDRGWGNFPPPEAVLPRGPGHG